MDASSNTSRSKEVLLAYARQGAHELGAALYPSGTAAQPPEYGMPWTRTPGQIADGMREQEPSAQPNPEPTALDAYVQHDAHGRDAQQPDAPEPQREPERDLDRD